MFVLNKLTIINKNSNRIINFPENAEKTYVYVTKITGATTGAAGVAKGSIDFAEAVACSDGIYAFISAVGLQISTSFIPGPNVTSVITMPISVGYKVLVYCCKK